MMVDRVNNDSVHRRVCRTSRDPVCPPVLWDPSGDDGQIQIISPARRATQAEAEAFCRTPMPCFLTRRGTKGPIGLKGTS